MKKLVMAVAVLMGVSTANVSVASDGMNVNTFTNFTPGSDLNVKALNGMKFILTLDNIQKKAYIAIKDSNGEILFSEYVAKTTNYTKVFDLSSLADGNYSFVVTNGTETSEKPFEISTEVKRSLKSSN